MYKKLLFTGSALIITLLLFSCGTTPKELSFGDYHDSLRHSIYLKVRESLHLQEDEVYETDIKIKILSFSKDFINFKIIDAPN